MHAGPDLFLDDISPSIVDYEGALLHHLQLPRSAGTETCLLSASPNSEVLG